MPLPPVLITGVAGFIGYHLALRYLRAGRAVTGIDNVNDYYDVDLKLARLKRLQAYPAHDFHRLDLSDRGSLDRVFERQDARTVIHLAAQAGVRHSLTNPHA